MTGTLPPPAKGIIIPKKYLTSFFSFLAVTVISGLLMFLLFVSELSYYLAVDVSL
jgi:hypothetical protein